MRLLHRRLLLPLLLFLVVPAAFAAEGEDPYVKLFKVQEGMAAKGDPLAEYYLGEMYESGLGTKPDLEQALSLYRRSAAKGNVLAKRKLEEIARDQEEVKKEKQRAQAEDQARARRRAEAEARAKEKADAKAKAKAEAEAIRLAKEQEQADEARLAKQTAADAAKREARRRAILEQARRFQQERAKEGDAFW